MAIFNGNRGETGDSLTAALETIETLLTLMIDLILLRKVCAVTLAILAASWGSVVLTSTENTCEFC